MPHDLMNLGPPIDLVAETAVRTAGAVAFTEGPAVDAEGSVFFSDIVNNRIMRRAPDGTLSVWRADSGRANGNMFDAQGRLVTCEGAEFGDGGRRRITRTDMRTGAVEVLTDRYEGKRYNSPNDLVIDNQGRIYFTDPRYKPDHSDLELDVEAVYRLDPAISTRTSPCRGSGSSTTSRRGGPDLKTLYIVSGKSLSALRVNVAGHVVHQRLAG